MNINRPHTWQQTMTQPDSASIVLQEEALRTAYQTRDAERCAIHHLNLSNHMEYGEKPAEQFLAHRLAAAVLFFQAGSELLGATLGNLAFSMAQFAPLPAPLPATLDQLCDTVETLDGIHLSWLVEGLNREGAADGEEALHAVLGMAQGMARDLHRRG